MIGTIAVVGEVVADAVVGKPADAGEPALSDREGPSSAASESLSLVAHPGGGPANTAMTLARLGSPVRFVGRISTGTLGRLCRARLKASGVDLTASIDAPEPATLAVASLDAHGSARYEFYANGTADWRWTEDELAGLLRPAPPLAIHAGSLALAMQPSGPRIEALLAAARRHSTISIDPNLRTGLVDIAVYREAIERWAAVADLVKLSSDDLAELWPDVEVRDGIVRLHDAGATLVVVTRGPDGVLASLRRRAAGSVGGEGSGGEGSDGEGSGGDEAAGGDEVLEVPGVPVNVVDTVGAGDSFAGGLLHALGSAGALGTVGAHHTAGAHRPDRTPDAAERGRLHDLGLATLRAALEFASQVAAITCSRPGANPPWAAELPPFHSRSRAR